MLDEEIRTDNTKTLKNALERIEELEKENADLKKRCSILDKSLVTSTKNNIERQKIIDELKEQLNAKGFADGAEYGYSRKCEETFNISLFQSQITHERAGVIQDNEWHRNEVPENENDILCKVAKDDFVVGFYRPSKKQYYTTDGQCIDVIAWKEIIPPKQEE